MNKRLVIKDVIHGNIVLENIYKELVESQEFQRLKDIKQTGTATIEYEDMKKETRFDHSIGSYHLMCRTINNIEDKLSRFGLKIDKQEKEIAKIAMLLHDIGHGSYSHTLEKITGCSHEKRTIDIVRDKNTQINKIITKYYGENFANKVVDFLELVYEHKKEKKPYDEVLVRNNTIKLNELLSSLISNNIDTDRLDYLIRDSKFAHFNILTDVYKLIDSFEFVFENNKMIVAIPNKNKYLAETAIFERTRNYEKVYYCDSSIIGDHILEDLLEELRKKPEEVRNSNKTALRGIKRIGKLKYIFNRSFYEGKNKQINVIENFLTNKNAEFTIDEYMMLTDTPVNEMISKIGEKTKDEKIKYLSNIKSATKDFEVLDTTKSEKYIRYLLHKAIPEIHKNTIALIDETRKIRPYKSTDTECINVITSEGIQKFEDLDNNINLKAVEKRVVAINKELIRLELGISKEEFDAKYKDTINEIIKTIEKPKDEFELKYIVQNIGIADTTKLRELLEKRYNIVDEVKYMSNDIYYDNPVHYTFLKNKETLRIRDGMTNYRGKETYKFKRMRISHKRYKDTSEIYTTRRKNEEIGENTNIEEYKDFLENMNIDKKNIVPILDVNNLRYLYTININGTLIDISFNTAYYKNIQYESIGSTGMIEIRPRDNQVYDRLSIIELKEFIESEIPNIANCITNSNIYEIGIVDTYEKYRKGYINNPEAEEYEKENPEVKETLSNIVKDLEKKKEFQIFKDIIPVEEFTIN